MILIINYKFEMIQNKKDPQKMRVLIIMLF